MLPIIVAFTGILWTPAGYLWIDYLLLMLIGCFIYPVINLITVAALDVASKKAIGTTSRIYEPVWLHGPDGTVKASVAWSSYYAIT